jgi:prepilin-type N-terminal cleavage/methylation domain-containing protein
MLSKLKKSKGEGFTIIEVMIVLAIAALILLIVFLAVPALQRNSRNTQRKSDVSQIASAIANFVSNNGGSLPTAVGTNSTDATTEALFCSGATVPNVTSKQTSGFSTGCTNTNTNSESAKLGYFKPADNHIFFANSPGAAFSVGTPGAVPTATALTTQSITIDLGYGCNSSNTNADTTASSRNAAVLYVTEVGGSNGNLQCIEQ